MKTSPFRIVFPLACASLCFSPTPSPAQAAGGQLQPQRSAASPGVWSAPPAGQAQQSAFQSACGNQPMCYDAADFAVAIVDFRMSTLRGSKVIDATLRFVNKTSQPLILGYVDNSAVALDDQGNRYGTYYNTGLAGIGIVNGANGDPKFVLQPGGAGDARFELFWRPGPQDPIGSTLELNMNIREINTLVGGQHTLGSEVPLRFQGLTNGMTGAGLAASTASGTAVPGAAGTAAVGVAPSGGANAMMAGASTLPPCNANGSQGGALNSVVGTANSVGGQTGADATSNAAAAITSLKSMFKRKKAAQPAAANAPAGPCAPAGTVTAPAATAQPTTIAQQATMSTSPVPNAARTQNVSQPTATAPTAVKSAPVASTGTATHAAKPAAPATTRTQNSASNKQPAAAKKKPAPAANQQKTDISH